MINFVELYTFLYRKSKIKLIKISEFEINGDITDTDIIVQLFNNLLTITSTLIFSIVKLVKPFLTIAHNFYIVF